MTPSRRAALFRIVLRVAPLLMCAGGVLVGLFIWNVVRVGRESEIVRLPLVEKQEVSFAEAGSVVLSQEGPRFSRRFAGLVYELSTHYGSQVEGRKALFGATSTGVSTMRREVRVFQIPAPGRYVLRVQKLGEARETDVKHRLVFSRPHLFQTLAYVAGIALAGCVFIAGLVFTLMGLLGKGSAP